MADYPPSRRVAFADLVDPGRDHEFITGVVDYQHVAGRWQFIEGDWPFIKPDQVDPARMGGLIGNFYDSTWFDVLDRPGIVAVDTSTSNQASPLPRVGNDDEAIGRLGAEYLLGRGFLQFGYLGWSRAWFSRRRQATFTETIADAGHPCAVFTVEGYARGNNIELISRWLSELPKPIALMGANDHFACMMIQAATELGLRVPDDVAILGVDNDRWTALMAKPQLSSIQCDSYQIGYRAAKLLDGLLDGEAPPPPQWIPPLGVVTRRSTDVTMSEDPLVARALAYIRDHCSRGINVEDVLVELGISRSSLETRLRAAIGKTPLAVITQARVDRAKHMLTGSDASMNQIANACGFTQRARFFKAFKQSTGLTPGQYRQQRRTALVSKTIPYEI